MLGAIIGDIAGSRFERHNHKSKDFEFFTERCSFTDDSVMTLAVARAIMETEKIKGHAVDGDYLELLGKMSVKQMREIGRRYPHCGYGAGFRAWLFGGDTKPYNSFGNGAVMRISPAGYTARSEGEAAALSKAVTEVTHDHPEGLKGAEAAAVAIFMARQGLSKDAIREKIGRTYYPLDFTIDGIRDAYVFDVTCQGSVPVAVEAFLESDSFEDAIRTAVSVGGDSDTLAAITGAIAEAAYGIPEALKQKALTYLDGALRAICEEWARFSLL